MLLSRWKRGRIVVGIVIVGMTGHQMGKCVHFLLKPWLGGGGVLSVALETTTTTSPCLTTECIREVASTLSKAYPFHTNRSWCLQSRPSQPRMFKGIILVKVPKASSSTASAVAIRIGKKLGCKSVYWDHGRGYRFRNFTRHQSFLFVSARHPTARAISRMWFTYATESDNITDEYIIDTLRTKTKPQSGTQSIGQGGFQLQYAALRKIPEWSFLDPQNPTSVHNLDALLEIVRKMLDAYGFWILTERLDESLVALSIVLGVPLGHILVRSSKGPADKYFYKKNTRKCRLQYKGSISSVVSTFLESDEWRASNYGDLLLHEVANQSLDLTIERIGRERFNMAYTEFKRLRGLEEKLCATWDVLPCSSTGELQLDFSAQYCYKRDIGCAYQCIDDLLANDTSSQEGITEGP